MNAFFSTPAMRALGGLTLLMLLIALGSYASLNFERMRYVDPMPATITVSGIGEVNAIPDIGQFSFSVNAEGNTAAAAQADSGERMNDILAYLGEAGISDADIKTTSYNLNPRWRYEERVCPPRSLNCPPGERVQDGFEVSQTVTVKVRETDQAGDLIAGVGDRGATNISNLSFTVDDPSALQAKARTAAIADAQEKAARLARDLGVRIVALSSFYEQPGYQPRAYDQSFMAMESGEGRGGAPSLPTGEEVTTVQVNVTYEVR